MDVADKTPAGCELQTHADVGPLYQLQLANSRIETHNHVVANMMLLTTLENKWN